MRATPIPVMLSILKRSNNEVLRATAVARMAMRTPIPVTVGTLRLDENMGATTFTWMAALRSQKRRPFSGWQPLSCDR